MSERKFFQKREPEILKSNRVRSFGIVPGPINSHWLNLLFD